MMDNPGLGYLGTRGRRRPPLPPSPFSIRTRSSAAAVHDQPLPINPPPLGPVPAATGGAGTSGGGGMGGAHIGLGTSRLSPAPAYRSPALLPLSRHVHIIMIGIEGSLFRPLDSILTDILRIPSPELLPLLHRLNTLAISFTQAIIRRRRALDFDPSSVLLPQDHTPAPRTRPDPP